jgi:hypothetical protein
MGYAILRIAPRKSTASAAKMVRHALREDAVPNALEDAPKPANGSGQGYGHGSSKEALAALHAKIEAAKKVRAGWQKSSTAALDILVTASREDMLAWDLPKQYQFFTKALEFIAARFGGKQNILAAAIHRDESTPHMQVILAPVDPITGRFSASKMVGGRAQLSQLQTDFHAACGAPFDLDRGIQRTAAQHVPVRAFYGAMEAGLESPAYVSVPAAPTMIDNLKRTYKAKQEAHEAALAKNAAIRKEVNKQAQRGRTVHPKVVARQAERYRKLIELTATVKQAEAAAKADRAAAEKANEKAGVRLELTNNLHTKINQVQQIMDSKTAAVLVAKFSKGLAPEYVATLAKNMGIPLLAGKDIPDQIRRSGHAKSLDEAVALMEKASDGQLVAAAVRRHQLDNQTHTDTPRPR